MFNKPERKKKGGFLPLVIFRILLSLTMLIILGLGVYQAFRYFACSANQGSGCDPNSYFSSTDPRTIITSLLTSGDITKTLFGILGTDLTGKVLPPSIAGDENPLPGVLTDDQPNKPGGDAKQVLKFAVVSDSHLDNDNLKKALNIAKKEGVKFVIGLGDYSDVGTTPELQKAKEVFASSGLPFYVTAGDHDLWDSRDKGSASSNNFSKVFGSTYQSFSDSNIRFVILFDSDNYEGVDSTQMSWLSDILDKVAADQPKDTFVFLHEPLYHPTSDRVMGKSNEQLGKQAEEIRNLLKTAKVNQVFAGDIHAYSNYDDPATGLKMVTVGALTAERNVQLPRFALVDVYDDGGYNILDTEIK